MWSSKEIREAFLKFFEGKGHKRLPSASLVPNDPSLLLTIAGMVPFKPYFLGQQAPPYTRVTTAQKCVRTTDIDNVGRTPRHHTFFEMLGNFSFGDYFKKEAITWAWELMTKVFKIPEERLWVSIYKEDEEAFEIWNKVVGVPEEKIVRMGKEDNFWSAGPQGPCGPCSEIYYDFGPKYGGGTPDDNERRYLEVWNLVFMQYSIDPDGNYIPLPKKNIDTGMGLERITAVLQGVYSNFDTDLFRPIISRIASLASVIYGKDEKRDIAIRVIADHVRAATFMVGDGILPSNEGRGYVLRRLIRRAVRYGLTYLDMKKPFLVELVPVVQDVLGGVYPEIVERSGFIEKVIDMEERKFRETLSQGLRLFDEIVRDAKLSGRTVIRGEEAFKLYDTYGFPIEMTKELAEENGLEVDEEGFEREMEKQRERARLAAEAKKIYVGGVFTEVSKECGQTRFVGYSTLEHDTKIASIVAGERRVGGLSEGEEGIVVLSETPFYAEAGGQVADTGVVETPTGTFRVEDVRKTPEGVFVHFGRVLEGEIKVGQEALAKVDAERRKKTAVHHTTTHLLHAALRRILGPHAVQSGSLVCPDYLRFDFPHFEPLDERTIREIEDFVNGAIWENIPVETLEMPYADAIRMGAMALFGEKYGEIVRVVKIGNVSAELCGGTHLASTGEAGLFKVVQETGIGTGLRRIVAVAGSVAFDRLREIEGKARAAASVLRSEVRDLPEKVKKLLEEVADLRREYEDALRRLVAARVDAIVGDAEEVDGLKVARGAFEGVPQSVLREAGDIIRSRIGTGVVVLASITKGKVMWVVMVTKDATGRISASDIARKVAQITGGSGGGRRDVAQAGGKDPARVREALRKVTEIVRETLRCG